MKMPFLLPARLLYLLPLVGLLLGASCTRQESRREGLVNYEPRLRVKTIEAASLGAVNVLPLKVPGDVDLPRRTQLIQGYVSKNLPLKMTLNVSVFNPNLEATSLQGVDYTVLVDGKILGSGRTPLAAELPASDSISTSLSFEMNTYKFLGAEEDALPALRNFALGFGDAHRERLILRMRPIMRTPRGRLSTLVHQQPVVLVQEAAARRPTNQND